MYTRRLLPAAGTPVLTDVIAALVGGMDTDTQVVKWVVGAEGIIQPISLGHQGSALSLPAALSTEDRALLTTLNDNISAALPFWESTADSTGAMNTRDGNADAQLAASVTPIAVIDPNGLSASRVAALASTNANVLKNSPGRIYDIDLSNNAASNKFLKLYNKTTAPTEADTPARTITLFTGGGYSKHFPLGIYFSAGIAYRITGGVADNDTTVLVANDVHGAIQWI